MGRGQVLLAAALLLPAFAPLGAAGHCEEDLYVYGRGSFTPGVVPPAGPVAAECILVPGGLVHDVVHTLAPGTDQVLVRMFVDIGPSYPHLHVKLEGFGWTGQVFAMERVQASATTYYSFPEWVYAPDPYEGTPLRASVRMPGGREASAEYGSFPVTVMTNIGR